MYASALGYKTIEYLGVKVKPIWSPNKKNIENIFHTAIGVAWIFKNRQQIDIVHFHSIGASLFAYAVNKMGICLVSTNHGHDYNRQKWGKLAKTILRIGEKVGAIYSDTVIAVSKTLKVNLSNKFAARRIISR